MLSYYEICHFPKNYGFVMFYSKGPPRTKKLFPAYVTAHFKTVLDYRGLHLMGVTIYIVNEVGQ